LSCPINYETLKDAIARKSGAVLSLPRQDDPASQQTLLAEAGMVSGSSAPEAERHLVEALMYEDAPVGVAFKAGRLCRFRRADRRGRSGFRSTMKLPVDGAVLPFLTAIASCSGGRLIGDVPVTAT